MKVNSFLEFWLQVKAIQTDKRNVGDA